MNANLLMSLRSKVFHEVFCLLASLMHELFCKTRNIFHKGTSLMHELFLRRRHMLSRVFFLFENIFPMIFDHSLNISVSSCCRQYDSPAACSRSTIAQLLPLFKAGSISQEGKLKKTSFFVVLLWRLPCPSLQ